MADNEIKIAVFKPYNARTTNSFYAGQHSVFRYLQKNYNYKITYFIDDKNIKFDTVNIRYIKGSRMKRYFFGKLWQLLLKKYKYYWKIPYYRNLDFSRYDIIITEGIHYPLLDYFKGIGHKVILNDSISLDYNLSSSQIKYLNKYFTKSLAIVVNDKIPILYRKNDLNIKVMVIGHAINTNLIPFIKRMQCQGKLISVGRLVPEKGFEYIIKAVAMLKNIYPNITLDIYGIGRLENYLKNLIASLKLENTVTLKGFLSYRKLISRLKEYDIFISHSLETSYIAEAFSMVNVEAMTNGLPVITSNCGGIPYVVKDRVILIEQKDINGIVSAVEDFMRDPQKVKKYSVEGRRYVEDNFDVKIIAKRWDKVITDFLKPSSIKI